MAGQNLGVGGGRCDARGARGEPARLNERGGMGRFGAGFGSAGRWGVARRHGAQLALAMKFSWLHFPLLNSAGRWPGGSVRMFTIAKKAVQVVNYFWPPLYGMGLCKRPHQFTRSE